MVMSLRLPPRTRGALGKGALQQLRRSGRRHGVFLTLRRGGAEYDDLCVTGPREHAAQLVEAVLQAAEERGVNVEDVDPPQVVVARRCVQNAVALRSFDLHYQQDIVRVSHGRFAWDPSTVLDIPGLRGSSTVFCFPVAGS